MAISLKKLRSSTSQYPPVVLLYGVDGVGKTTLAAEFPSPLYLPTAGERTPEGVDLATPEDEDGNAKYIESWADLKDIVGDLLSEDHDFKTVIFDSLDGLEPVINTETCVRIGADSIGSNRSRRRSSSMLPRSKIRRLRHVITSGTDARRKASQTARSHSVPISPAGTPTDSQSSCCASRPF